MSPPPPQRIRRRLLVLAIAIVLSPLVAELGLRWLLFGKSDLAIRHGMRFRQASLYAPLLSERYWILRRLLSPYEGRRYRFTGRVDSNLGWVNEWIAPETHVNQYDSHIGDRRPALLFGASNLRPVQSQLLESSELSGDWFVVPYGVGGFGLGQMRLLIDSVIGRYAEQRPLVLVGLTVPGDLDRVLVSMREHPKPRFELDDAGQLRRVDPASMDLREYVENSNDRPWSYLVASAFSDVGWLPGSRKRAVSRNARTMRATLDLHLALLEEIREIVDHAGARLCVLILQNKPVMLTATRATYEQELLERLEATSIDYIEARPRLHAMVRQQDVPIEAFFIPPGKPRPHHYNERGEHVIAQMIQAAIRGEFDRLEPRARTDVDGSTTLRALDQSGMDASALAAPLSRDE